MKIYYCKIFCLVVNVLLLGHCSGGDSWSEERKFCVDLINQYRADHDRSPLTRSRELEKYADEGAREDAHSGRPHGHFIDTAGGGIADAENELPGWPLAWYDSVEEVIRQGTASMMSEGPGGGHYENILGNHTHAGCGIYVTADKNVWVVQDFR